MRVHVLTKRWRWRIKRSTAGRICLLCTMRRGIILSASLRISLPLLVQTQYPMHTSLQETAINFSRESILRVQWGESVCSCTVKNLLHHSWTDAARASIISKPFSVATKLARVSLMS